MASGNTGWQGASGAIGDWANGGNVAAADGNCATAIFSVVQESPGVYSYNSTGLLKAYGLGSSSVDARVVGIEVEVGAKSDASPPHQWYAQIWIDGSPQGSPKAFNPGGSIGSNMLGGTGDTWGCPAFQANYIGHLWVVVWVDSSGTSAGNGTASVDWVSMRLTYEQVDAFSFTAKTDQPLSTTVESDVKTITGVTSAQTVAVSGGEWRKNGGTYTSSAGTVTGGDTVQVRHTTSGSYGATVTTSLNVGGTVGTFSSTTRVVDTTPDAFGFTTVNGANPGAQILSNTVAITGINGPSPWSVPVGVTLQLNGVNQGSASGTLNNNDTVALIANANGAFNGTVTVSLTVGGVVGNFTINTRAADTTPNAYAWTDVSGQLPSTLITSNVVTVSGIEAAAQISFTALSNGTVVSPAASAYEYRINGGAWLACAGATPTITNGQTLQLRVGSNATLGAATNITTNIGGVVDSWTVTTTTGDQVPDPFTFPDEPGAGVSSLITSEAVTITGIDLATTVAFSAMTNGTVQAPATHAYEYSINGGAWQDCAGTAPTVNNNDVIRLRLGTAGLIGVTSTITVTIGGVSDTWAVTSADIDTAPNPFTFPDVAGVDVNTDVTSAVLTITGINAPASISVAGGSYSVNGGAFTSSPGTINRKDTVQLTVKSAATLTTTINVTLTIGGVSDTWSVTTRSPDLSSQYVITFRETVYGADV